MRSFFDLDYYNNINLLNEVKELLDLGADPSSNNNFAIRWSSEHGHKEVVELLLKDPRVDPSSDDNCAIKWSSNLGYTEVVELLLKDPRVQVKSYQLGQKFHTEEQISELKRTKPYLFI